MNPLDPVARLRAWMAAFVLVAAGGVLGLLLLAPDPARPPAPAACRALEVDPPKLLACLEGRLPDILTAELAGAFPPWACQLYRRPLDRVSEIDELRCAELRTQGLRQELRGFDEGFFIPLYGCLSLLLIGVLVAETRLVEAKPRRQLQWLALGLTLATATLVWADRQENRALLEVLDRLDAWGVASWLEPATALTAAVDTAAAAARRASSWKWAASLPWILLLGLGSSLALRQGWPLQRAGPAPRYWRVAAWLPLLLATAAALALAVSLWWLLQSAEASALPGGAVKMPASWIGRGMTLAIVSLLSTAVLMALALWHGRLPPEHGASAVDVPADAAAGVAAR